MGDQDFKLINKTLLLVIENLNKEIMICNGGKLSIKYEQIILSSVPNEK